MSIGNLLLKNNVFLAPMAGITNLPFRTLIKDFGCGLTFTEMISANGLIRNSARSFEYLCSSPLDRPLAVQLFGSEPSVLAAAAKIVAGQGADLIDINMGCPARKIVRTGAGSALLKNPQQIGNIIKAVREAVSLPLTVKIRSGCSAREINAPEVAHIAEDCGADAVIVHPRTADQGFGGRADWDVIKQVKQEINIPVIGNGDIRQATDALAMITHTGCDGVMVGRGVLGNPWLMGEIIACLSDQDLPACPSLPERLNVIVHHLDMELQYHGEAGGSRNFRKHLLWYTKSLPGGAKFRQLAVNLSGKESMLDGLQHFFLSGNVGKEIWP